MNNACKFNYEKTMLAYFIYISEVNDELGCLCNKPSYKTIYVFKSFLPYWDEME